MNQKDKKKKNKSILAHYTNSVGYGGSYSQLFGVPPSKLSEKKEKKEALELEKDDLLEKIKTYHKDLLSNPPKLSKKVEEQLSSNYSQLMVAEGNIHSSVPDAKSFYITSCFPKEGKTTASISLSYGLALFSNRKVLLIDAHFTSPYIHLFFNIKVPASFLEIISDFSLDSIIKSVLPTSYENLFILPHTKEIHTVESLSKEAIKEFIKLVDPHFDYIIFDGRSLLFAPEPVLFAEVIDAVIFVVECERTKWEVLQAGVEKIFNVKGKVAGVVLNKRKFYIPTPIYKLL